MSIVPAVRLLDGVITDRTEGEAFSSACLGADVVSVSWGPTDSGYVADMPGRLLQEAIETCVQQVRRVCHLLFKRRGKPTSMKPAATNERTSSIAGITVT